MRITTTDSQDYSESGQDIFPTVYITYEFFPPSIDSIFFVDGVGENTDYSISPQVDRFSKVWEDLAKR